VNTFRRASQFVLFEAFGPDGPDGDCTSMDPAQLKYATSHEWLSIEGGVATIGITDFAVKQLTDLVYVDLPKPGKRFDVGDTFGEVESVKAVSDLYAPVSGEVTEVNQPVADDPAILSTDPFGKGWLIKLKVAGPVPSDLLDHAAYQAHCASEAH
jgi:glycine cleavage system H protein